MSLVTFLYESVALVHCLYLCVPWGVNFQKANSSQAQPPQLKLMRKSTYKVSLLSSGPPGWGSTQRCSLLPLHCFTDSSHPPNPPAHHQHLLRTHRDRHLLVSGPFCHRVHQSPLLGPCLGHKLPHSDPTEGGPLHANFRKPAVLQDINSHFCRRGKQGSEELTFGKLVLLL